MAWVMTLRVNAFLLTHVHVSAFAYVISVWSFAIYVTRKTKTYSLV